MRAAHEGTTETTHAFVRAYDLDGEVTGEVLFDSSTPGSGTSDIGQSVAVDETIVYVTGGTGGVLGAPGSSLGGRDAFLARVPAGELRGGVVFAGTG